MRYWDRAALVITAPKSMHQRLQIELTWQMTRAIESAALNNSLFIFAMLRKDAKSPTAQAQACSEVTEMISALTNPLPEA